MAGNALELKLESLYYGYTQFYTSETISCVMLDMYEP